MLSSLLFTECSEKKGSYFTLISSDHTIEVKNSPEESVIGLKVVFIVRRWLNGLGNADKSVCLRIAGWILKSDVK